MSFVIIFPELFLIFGLFTTVLFRLFKPLTAPSHTIPFLLLITAILCFLSNTDKSEFVLGGLLLNNESIIITKVIFLLFTSISCLLYQRLHRDLIFGIIGLGECIALSAGNLIVLLFAIEVIFIGFYLFFKAPKDYNIEIENGDTPLPSFNNFKLFASTSLIGFLCILTGIIFLYTNISTFWSFVLILTGFFIKAGTFPFQNWQTITAPNLPTSTLCLLTTSIVPLLTWLLVRYSFSAERFSDIGGFIFMIFGTLTLFISSLYSIRITNLKTLLTLFSISNLGLILCFAGTEQTSFALSLIFYFIITQGLCLTGLFVGLRKQSEIQDLQGLSYCNFPKSIILIILILCAAGLPPTLGFLSKMNLITYMINNGNYLFSAFIITFMIIWIFSLSRLIVSILSPVGETPQEKKPFDFFTIDTFCSIFCVLGLFYSFEFIVISLIAAKGFMY